MIKEQNQRCRKIFHFLFVIENKWKHDKFHRKIPLYSWEIECCFNINEDIQMLQTFLLSHFNFPLPHKK